MWALTNIILKNIASFERMSYQINQGVTTLIFGNNLDNDSQGSNGSGKSALLEGVSLALTGETLRKVKGDEIINDNHDEAIVEALFRNNMSGEEFLVTRTLSRKNPQKIECAIYQNGEEVDTDEVKQSSVAEYNKYILEKIGLSKDDVFGNFVLSKHKFSSFLSSSDKEKKEIINRFSNAILVDEAIEALAVDIKDAEAVLRESELQLSKSDGNIEAIETQIENAKNDVERQKSNKETRRIELEAAISSKEEELASLRGRLRDGRAKHEKLSVQLMGAYEEINASSHKLPVSVAYESILKVFDDACIAPYTISNWGEKAEVIAIKIEKLNSSIAESSKAFRKISLNKKSHSNLLEGFERELAEMTAKSEVDCKAYNEEIIGFIKEHNEAQQRLNGLRKREAETVSAISNLENVLAGTITCPECSHKFVLDASVNVAQATEERDKLIASKKQLSISQEDVQQEIYDIENDINEVKVDIKASEDSIDPISLKVKEYRKDLRDIEEQMDCTDRDIKRYNGEISTLSNSLSQLATSMFDEVLYTIQSYLGAVKRGIETVENSIIATESTIQTYKQSLISLDTIEETDVVGMLQKQLKQYVAARADITVRFTEAQNNLNALLDQERQFVEFKTHLANTKVEALSKITNEFLEKIGSDIQIKFSGFTVLKSGKVRDKISISLIRDGLDCGSFDKFSEGEKARVNLANILALHKLTNLNCEDGKGLDLLVLDEILEATDENGLANIFGALNALKITALVVSHGNVAENYPHRLLINKQNGISYVNGTE